MQPSSSQKTLRILSYIVIVLGVFTLLMGIVAVLGGGLIASEGTDANAESVGEGVAVIVIGVIILIAGILTVLEGWFGLRAAKNNQKVMPVWWFSLISLVFGVVSVIMQVVSGGGLTAVLDSAASLALSAVIFYLANNIKKEAGR